MNTYKMKKNIKLDIKRIEDTIKKDRREAKKDNTELDKDTLHKRFDIIYTKYGQAAYIKYVPKKYRYKDVEKLLKERRFLEIYEKHGEKIYKKHLEFMELKDVKNEIGNHHVLRHEAMECLKKIIRPFALTSLCVIVPTEVSKAVEVINYKNQIDSYIEEINDYGKKVQSYELTDLQNIMLIMDDMWNKSMGYGEPTIDLETYPGLDMSEQYRIGVCRNMADDYARRLNATNPEYNARTITVYYGDGQYKMPSITKKHSFDRGDGYYSIYVYPNSEITLQGEVPNLDNDNDNINEKVGNHEVVVMDLPKEDVELIIDPTNPSIGVMQNGEITLLNSLGLEYPQEITYTPYGGIVRRQFTKVIETPYNYIKSMNDVDIEELNKRFGVEAQNEALEEVRAMTTDQADDFKARISYKVQEYTYISTIQYNETQSKFDDIENDKELE